ncbi:MAG TPA: ABC transporter substrate-binding protein [Stellaceae bacterium]|nr:ABC transporter substrate-binding protein [Stellaceae bacterium]
MNRRDFLALLAAGATAPTVAFAQQSERVRSVGVLTEYPENNPLGQSFVTTFAQAMGRLGWAGGKNIRIDYRFAAYDPALFGRYAAELASLSPDAILSSTTLALAALRQQTRTIPIVFMRVIDPVGQGFVQSLARPGGNMTGFSSSEAPLMGKWLQLLKEIAPDVTRVGVIFFPDTPAALRSRAIEAAASPLGIGVTLAPVHDDSEIEQAIAAQAREPGGGLVALPGGFADAHRDVIIAAATRHRLPLMGAIDPGVGGLMSYWFDPVDLYAGAASYIDRILKGANPADLPVQQPTKYLLVLNLKTAKSLSLTVPQSILARADEVIE